MHDCKSTQSPQEIGLYFVWVGYFVRQGMCLWKLGGENQVRVQTSVVCLPPYVQFGNISKGISEQCYENTMAVQSNLQ